MGRDCILPQSESKLTDSYYGTNRVNVPGREIILLSWLQLLRLPTVFTALADIFCGWCVTHQQTRPMELFTQSSLAWLLLSSACLYLSGMVLNDVFDFRQDAAERPERPIPAGHISLRSALLAGAVLMVGGLSAARMADRSAGAGNQCLILASLIAAGVLAYDGILKNTKFGPLMMAACRFLNLLLGAGTAVGDSGSSAVGIMPALGIAAALSTYIIGVTWFARNEAGAVSLSSLQAGLLVAVMAVVIDGGLALYVHDGFAVRAASLGQLALIACTTLLHGVWAIRAGDPATLQRTVGKMLLWIIVLDAVMIFAVTGNILLEATVLLLVVPVILLRRTIRMS